MNSELKTDWQKFTVTLPRGIVAEMDKAVRVLGMSRNSYIVRRVLADVGHLVSEAAAERARALAAAGTVGGKSTRSHAGEYRAQPIRGKSRVRGHRAAS